MFGKKKKDIKDALDAVVEEEGLGEQEREMIEGVITLDEVTVKETLVPRVDTVFINAAAGRDVVIAKASEHGYSRYPVFKDTIDNVIGILYVKDLLPAVMKGTAEDFDVTKIVRDVFFVPESKKLDSLLSEFKRRRVHIAVVIDEYGGVSGIVCMEDIIERIVGDIQDEFDDEGEDCIRIGAREYLCRARMNIDVLNEELGLKLPNSDFDTVGGFVFDLFGKIPVRDEALEYQGARFVIHELDGHKIKNVKIILKEEDEAPK